MAIIGDLIGMTRGVRAVRDEWNKILPGYRIAEVEKLLG